MRCGCEQPAIDLSPLPRRERRGEGDALHFLFSPVWRYLLPGSFLAAYLSMALWVAGFKYTSASVAAVLNQTSMIFAIILAAIFLHEKLTARKLGAVCIAAGGVLMITLEPKISMWLR
ncbi:MAG: DMT family transporter [Planctomycetes bacterium]|nr:DMT family transporter [Planctomycetota bacterium]